MAEGMREVHENLLKEGYILFCYEDIRKPGFKQSFDELEGRVSQGNLSAFAVLQSTTSPVDSTSEFEYALYMKHK